MNRILEIVGIGIIPAIAASTMLGCADKEREKPNVIFISVDDLRPSIGAYGDIRAITPNMDRLAEQGVLFERAYVQQASCAPSRTSILTGLRPDEIGVIDHVTHFRDTRPDLITLPQLFKLQGYETVGIGKIFHWARGYNDSVSWTRELFESNPGMEQLYFLPENQTGRKAASVEKVDVEDNAYLDGKITEEAINALKMFTEKQVPFFLGIGYFQPHLPFTAPEKYWNFHDREKFYPLNPINMPANAPEIAFHNWQELRGYVDIPDEGPLSVEKVKELRHGYYAGVSFIDEQIGKILEALDDLGIRDNTIIVFWGDHGYHLGEQNSWCKSTNFELDVHAPLIISAPGIYKKGAKCNAIVEFVDLYPTIIDLCRINAEGDLSGVSLKPLLIDPEKEWKNNAFSQFPRPYNAAISGREPKSHIGYSVRTDKWRYTIWYNLAKGLFEYPELYSMKEALIEAENLSGRTEHAEIESEHHELIQNYLFKRILSSN
jgi:iduronate 2-sulfatase